ncbi:MAG: ABC transporter permease [Acidobacteriia bacterium]|nr:ABC transporter permease [Terriglobia bacterium]
MRDLLDLIFEAVLNAVLEVQNYTLHCSRAFTNLFHRPHYLQETLVQMDIIGVGSLTIICLTGFFTGAVLAMQSAKSLQSFGAVGLTGQLVAVSLVRELGPVLSALMMAGRNSSGMASEIGSMVVSDQILAMRALGTDPSKKLVTPRLVATVTMLPLLTAVCDFIGIFGGYIVSRFLLHISSALYWSTVYHNLTYNDLLEGLLKPFVFGAIVATIGCYCGIRTYGGTQGVGRSTTQAVVAASILILAVDAVLTRIALVFFR